MRFPSDGFGQRFEFFQGELEACIASQLPARGQLVNGHSHRMPADACLRGLFSGRRGQQLYTAKRIFVARENKYTSTLGLAV